MIEAHEKTVLWWICPNCARYNDVEKREDKAIPDELECIYCYHEDKWEIKE